MGPMAPTLSEQSRFVHDAQSERRWKIPAGQHFVSEEFDDGIVMFDALVGATHLLNATAAETLDILQEHGPAGLATSEIHRELLERLQLGEDVIPLAAVEELVWRLEDLGLIAASTP